MSSPRGGLVANQYIIQTEHGEYFQSYSSVIAFIPNQAQREHGDMKIVLDEKYWDYSTTTGKYRNMFLGESKADTQRKIDSGEYLLTNLNI